MTRLYGLKMKEHAFAARVIRAAFPNYRKQSFSLSEFYSGKNISSYWDGGSRDEFALVDLETFARLPLPTTTHPYFDIAARGLANQSTDVIETDRVGNLRLKVLPPGVALVEAGTFCGKPATAHIYLHADNMLKLLPAPAGGGQ